MMLLMGPGVASAAGLQISSLLNRALASDIVGAQSHCISPSGSISCHWR